ncbi:hypothetical protein NMG60_11032919 [Bertholletia excelsa]
MSLHIRWLDWSLGLQRFIPACFALRHLINRRQVLSCTAPDVSWELQSGQTFHFSESRVMTQMGSFNIQDLSLRAWKSQVLIQCAVTGEKEGR